MTACCIPIAILRRCFEARSKTQHIVDKFVECVNMLCFNKGGDGIGNTAHIALVDDVENADLVNVGLLIV